MADLITFADVESLLIAWLNTKLDAGVYHSVPPDRTESSSFVVLTRTGGINQTMVSDAAQITVDSWAPTTPEAAELANEARAHLHTLQYEDFTPPVYGVDELSGVVYLPDPDSTQPRYVFSVIIHLRAASTQPI